MSKPKHADTPCFDCGLVNGPIPKGRTVSPRLSLARFGEPGKVACQATGLLSRNTMKNKGFSE